MAKVEPDKVNGLNKISAADGFQIRSVSQARFVRKLGIVTEQVMEDIRNGLAKVLTIDYK